MLVAVDAGFQPLNFLPYVEKGLVLTIDVPGQVVQHRHDSLQRRRVHVECNKVSPKPLDVWRVRHGVGH